MILFIETAKRNSLCIEVAQRSSDATFCICEIRTIYQGRKWTWIEWRKSPDLKDFMVTINTVIIKAWKQKEEKEYDENEDTETQKEPQTYIRLAT